MNPVLPIIVRDSPKTISYSALSDHHYCPYYYLLANINRLKPWKNNADTIFGTYIHKAVQDVLSGVMSVDDAIKLFNRKWKTLCKLYKKFLNQDDIDMGKAAPHIIKKIQAAIILELGQFSVMQVEEKLALPASQKWPQTFKGFIDIVLRLENGKIVIIDFKTSDSAFFFNQYRDKYKDYQLTLYKHYYCEKYQIDPDSVETYFAVLEKNLKSKKHIELVRITSGDVKVQNALKWLEFILSAINRKIFVKNKTACLKYGEGHPCAFHKTPLCP